MEKKIIEHNLNFYVLDQDLYEPDELFQDRVNYIVLNLEKDNFNNLVKKSRLLSNMKNFGCEYNGTIIANL